MDEWIVVERPADAHFMHELSSSVVEWYSETFGRCDGQLPHGEEEKDRVFAEWLVCRLHENTGRDTPPDPASAWQHMRTLDGKAVWVDKRVRGRVRSAFDAAWCNHMRT